MKKLILIPAIIGILGTSVYAADGGKKDEIRNEVSYTVQNQFNSDFNDAKNIVWTVTANVQKVDFLIGNVKKTAFYNLQGEYLGLTQYVDYKEVSAKAKNEIEENYSGYLVNQVIKLQTDDAVTYFVDLKNQADEILVRVGPTSNVYFFQQVK